MSKLMLRHIAVFRFEKAWTMPVAAQKFASSNWLLSDYTWQILRHYRWSPYRQKTLWKSPTWSAPFHVPTFYWSTKIYLGDLRAVFVDHRTDSSGEFVKYSIKRMSNTQKIAFFFSKGFYFHVYAHIWQTNRKEAWLSRPETCQFWRNRDALKTFSNSSSTKLETQVVWKVLIRITALPESASYIIWETMSRLMSP